MQPVAEWGDADPSGVELLADGSVRQDHAASRLVVANLPTVVVMLRLPVVSGLTIHEASVTTGWSARMLRYIEESGLVVPSPLAGRATACSARPSCSACARCASCWRSTGWSWPRSVRASPARRRSLRLARRGLAVGRGRPAVRGRPVRVARVRAGEAHRITGRGSGYLSPCTGHDQGDGMSYRLQGCRPVPRRVRP